MSLRVFSYGGGVQSTAALVLAARGQIDFPVFVFSNVGENTENPDTLTFVRDVTVPYAAEHSIEFHELEREWKDGRGWSLLDTLYNSQKSIGIPAKIEGERRRTQDRGARMRRNCTVDFKIRVIGKWLREHGATKESPAVGLGISLDEWKRMRTDSGIPYETLEYPLFKMRINRSDCEAIIRREGLPVPPKSSCWFCPYHRLPAWRELKRTKPELFEQAVHLEAMLSQRGEQIGTGSVYLTDQMVPLEQAVGRGVQHSLLDEDDSCESGYCMT